jgi:hypothetical protein
LALKLSFLHGKGASIDDLNGVKRIASMPMLVEEDFEGFIRQGKEGVSKAAFMELAEQVIIRIK